MKITSRFVNGLAATSLALFAASGCVVVVDNDKKSSSRPTSFEERQADNRAALSSFKLGISPAEVIERMGTADFDELLVKNGMQYRVLYYRTHRVTADSMTTKDECTPLVFADNELLGWGDSKLKLVTSE